MATLFWWTLWKSLSGQLGSMASLIPILVWCNKVPQTRCFNTAEMNSLTFLEDSSLPSRYQQGQTPCNNFCGYQQSPALLDLSLNVSNPYLPSSSHGRLSSLCIPPSHNALFSVCIYLCISFLLLYKHQLYWVKSFLPYSNMTLSWLVTSESPYFKIRSHSEHSGRRWILKYTI